MSPVGRVLLVAGVAAALALPRVAVAQTCSAPLPSGTCPAPTSTTMTAGTVMQLSLGSTSTALTAPSIASYDAGLVADNGPTATIKSNRPWRLQISAATITWAAANTEPGVSARTNKPAADLLWTTTAGGPFTGLSTTGTDAQTGGATGNTTLSFFYRTLYNWTLDTPGAYSLAVVFTLTNQ